MLRQPLQLLLVVIFATASYGCLSISSARAIIFYSCGFLITIIIFHQLILEVTQCSSFRLCLVLVSACCLSMPV